MKIKGLILAAGRGSRLGELTNELPKPLVTVAGKRLIDWQIAALNSAGIDDITIVTGYRADTFDDIPANKINNPIWDKSNMVRSLLCADEVLRSSVTVISYGDILYHPDIASILVKQAEGICLSYDTKWHELWSARFSNVLDDAESFIHKNGYLQSIGQRVDNVDLIQGQYMGLLVIDPDGWKSIRDYLDTLDEQEINALDMTAMISQLLLRKVPVKLSPVDGRWVEVDNQTDIQIYENKINNNQNWAHDWRW